MLDKILAVSTITTNLFVVLGVVIAIFQLKKMKESNLLQSQSIIADHERRKKQSTLESYSSLYPHLSELRTIITDTFGKEYINPTDERYINNPELQKIIYEYLVIMERFSVGILSGVYDIDIFENTSGKTVADIYKKLSPLIENMRITENYPEMFCSFEQLSEEIFKIREKNNYNSTNKLPEQLNLQINDNANG